MDRALRVLDDHHRDGPVPVLKDLLRVIQEAPETVRSVALDRGNLDRYKQITESLEASLMAMVSGDIGDMFGRPTSDPMKLDRPVGTTSPPFRSPRPTAEQLRCWPAGRAGSGRSTQPPRWPRPAWRRSVSTSSS